MVHFLFFAFYFQKSHSPCRKKRIFEKQAKNNNKTTHFYKLKTGPIMLRNMLGPVLNLYLDQFLTYKICYFFLFVFVFLAETPIFIVFSARIQNLKKHKKEKKKKHTHTICEHNCANCSCSSVLFFCIFHICCFFSISVFLKMFLFGFPKSKKYKNPKQAKQKTKTKGRQKMQNKNK